MYLQRFDGLVAILTIFPQPKQKRAARRNEVDADKVIRFLKLSPTDTSEIVVQL